MCWRSSTRLPTAVGSVPVLMKLWLTLAGFPSVVPRPIVPDWVLLQYTNADPDDWASAGGTATRLATSIATGSDTRARHCATVVTRYRPGSPSPPPPCALRRDGVEAAEGRLGQAECGVDVGCRGAEVGQRIVIPGEDAAPVVHGQAGHVDAWAVGLERHPGRRVDIDAV